MKQLITATGAVMLAAASTAIAHEGRRFVIQVVDNQIVVQGHITTGVDDGAGVERPYFNSLHDNWQNNPSFPAASAWLPGFDLFTPGPLLGGNLSLTLIGGSKWVNPPASPKSGTIPDFQALSPSDEIFVGFDGEFVSTSAPGSLEIAAGTPSTGAADIDVTYDIALSPSNVIYVLEFRLSTNAPGVLESELIHVMLAPDATSPSGALLEASLFLESFFGLFPCPGDLSGDGIVNGADLASLLASWGAAGPADLNGDGVVNGVDLAALLAGWGACN